MRASTFTGVSPKQVQTVEVVTEPTFVHESSNATDAEHADAEITDDILTVRAGRPIVCISTLRFAFAAVNLPAS